MKKYLDLTMDKYPPRIPKYLYHITAPVVIIILTTFLLYPTQPYLAIQIILLVYLLPVMLSTVMWGLTSGVLASVSAFLAFNYYFLAPYHTLRVHATQDLITLFIFLLVAVVMSQLIGRAREGVTRAEIREWEATRMYELISGLAGLQDSHAIAERITQFTRETFECLSVATTYHPFEGNEQETIYSPEDDRPEELPSLQMPILTTRSIEGTLRIWRKEKSFSAEELRLLEAFASQGALALERIRLTRGENKARVLEESDKLKTSLLNSVSHELRSPLAAIKASVSSLRSGSVDWDSADRQELLATIEEETDQLNQLVGNLLDMSRIESGSLKPNLRWNSINEIVRGVAVKMRKLLVNHTLVIDLADTLPTVLTDYVLMEQVFTNLISNSIKYAPAGSTIRVSGHQEGDNLHIMLTNEGPPVPEEHLEHIFDKFYRITNADRVTGTGLGLSICKGIIEAHNGKIWAANQEKGFSFNILLASSQNPGNLDAVMGN